uniref:ER membrane protein complex subunit 3 n=1 Tax=Schistocephalus solidus TaxID=70667 RepID=A0A0V0J720_SCHSO
MAELFLDSAIRFWVFLPIVIITFLFGVIRHHLMSTLTSNKKSDLQGLSDSHALIRSRLLRENGNFITRNGFKMRKHFFNDKEVGYFKVQKRENAIKNPISDPTMLTDMLKGNILNVMPMLVIGGWINWAFSGFLTTKVPFPLTHRFKPMLQRGCETLVSLDASWVSSASWYFLNIFGLRSLHGLVLGSDNAADQTTMMQEQIMAPTQAPPDMQKAFKAEWEAVEVVEHNWALKCCEKKLV